MKRFDKIIAVLLVLSTLAVTFYSCTGTSGDGETESLTEISNQISSETETENETEGASDTETESEADGEIILGDPMTYTEVVKQESDERVSLLDVKYNIVCATSAPAKLKAAAATVANEIYGKYGKMISIKNDTIFSKTDAEIIVGDTNRGVAVDESELSYYDYGWTAVDGKIFIFGGSVEAIERAVLKMIEKYGTETALNVPENVEYRAYYSYPYSNIKIDGTDISEYKIISKKSCGDAADAAFCGFGRLCGIKLDIVNLMAGEQAPTGKYIYVGVESRSDMRTEYCVENGSLYFISNGETNEMDILDETVCAFFEKHFSAGDRVATADVQNGVNEEFVVKFEYLEYVDDDFTDKFDKEFEERRDEILNSEAEWETGEGGRVFYLSSSTGNDDNDGLSPDTAWKSLAKVNSDNGITAGDVVLLKRGDEWNREGSLKCKTGVTYSAYGTGNKPMISKYIEANKVSDWTAVAENIWVYSGDYASQAETSRPNDESIVGTYLASNGLYGSDNNHDVGNIVLVKKDGSVGWGIKMTMHTDRDVWVAVGKCDTGFDEVTHGGVPAPDGGRSLQSNYEFYHDHDESRLYFYWDGGNPAEAFSSMKITLRGFLVQGSATDVIVDNLAIKYAGAHGVDVGQANNFTVRNCEIGWMGGSIQSGDFGGGSRDYPTRFGEGIQNWGDCHGFYIYNNYLYQVYDGAVSSQYSRNANKLSLYMDDVLVKDNIFECNQGNFEFWMTMEEWQGNNPNYKFSNFLCEDNLIRRAGYGTGAVRRAVDHSSAAFHGSFGWPNPIMENCVIKNNVVWDAKFEVFFGHVFHTVDRYNMYDNIIVHPYNTKFAHLAADFDHMQIWGSAYYMYNDETVASLIDQKVIGVNKFYFTYGS